MPNANPLILDRFTFGDTVTVIPAHDLPTLYFRVPAGMGGNPENSPMIRGFDCYDKASAATEAGAFGTFRNDDGCGVDRGVSWYAREHAPSAPEAPPSLRVPVNPVESDPDMPFPITPRTSTEGVPTADPGRFRYGGGEAVQVGDTYGIRGSDSRWRVARIVDGVPYESPTSTPSRPARAMWGMSHAVLISRAQPDAATLANEIRAPGGVARALADEISDFDDDDRRIVIDALAESLSREMLRRWRTAFPGTSDGIEIRPGRRHLKILRGGSVAAFVDRTTGDVFKPASHSRPADHARGNVLSATQGREALDGHGFVRYLR